MTQDTSVDEIQSQALGEIGAIQDLQKLDEWRVAYLGRSGRLTSVLRGLGGLPAEARKEAGQRANVVKSVLEKALEEKEKFLRQAELQRSIEAGKLDVTLPGRRPSRGRL